MKKLLSLVAIIAFSATSFAQTKGPKIEFKAKENTIDYGTVSRDSDSGLRTFEFKNTGDAPLIVTNVQSSCGCTVPSKPTEPIMPGKEGKIDVKYNMSPGKIAKTITVESNAVNVPEGRVSLRIKGEVVVKEAKSDLEKPKAVMQTK
ncbi:MAG: DUF1573 domain-containing protein [Flavobacterium sp.]|nr:DUF1573 domain-containing protein [Candidatus Neoflavobacterium equi]